MCGGVPARPPLGLNVTNEEYVVVQSNFSRDDPFLTKREKIYEKRRDLVKKVCNKYQEKSLQPKGMIVDNMNAITRNNFQVDGKNGLAVCLNAKVSSRCIRVSNQRSCSNSEVLILSVSDGHVHLEQILPHALPSAQRLGEGLEQERDGIVQIWWHHARHFTIAEIQSGNSRNKIGHQQGQRIPQIFFC